MARMTEQPEQGTREMVKWLAQQELDRAKRSQERAANKPKYRPPTGFKYKDPMAGWSDFDRWRAGTAGGPKTEKQIAREAKERAERQAAAQRRKENARNPRQIGGGGWLHGKSNLDKLRAFSSPAQQEALANATRSGSPTGLKVLSQQAGVAGPAGPAGQAGAAGLPPMPPTVSTGDDGGQAHLAGTPESPTYIPTHRLPGGGMPWPPGTPEATAPWGDEGGQMVSNDVIQAFPGQFGMDSTVPTPGGGEATLGGTPEFPQYFPSDPGSMSPPSRVGGTIEHGTIETDLSTGQETEVSGPTEPLMVSPSTREEFMGGMPPMTPPVGTPDELGVMMGPDPDLFSTGAGEGHVLDRLPPFHIGPPPPMSDTPPMTPPVGDPGPMGPQGAMDMGFAFGGSPGDMVSSQGVSLGSNPALSDLATNSGAMPLNRKPKLRAGSRFGMT